MDNPHALYLLLILVVTLTARWPLLRLPLDEDLATFTYIARFKHLGLRWKHDAYMFLLPGWRLLLNDKVYGNPETGPVRFRLYTGLYNALTGIALYGLVYHLTQNEFAALAGGLAYALFHTAPAMEAESFNTEPFYLPFLLLGLYASLLGPDMALWAGAALGFMVLGKLTTGIYLPAFWALTFTQYGLWPAFQSMFASAIVIGISFGIDWKLGFLDETARAQMRTRMVATLRCARRDTMLAKMAGDLKMIAKQTLPLWAFGLPGLWLASQSEASHWILTALAITGVMIFLQRGFSRYHYLPLLSFLCMASGITLSGANRWGADVSSITWTLFLLLTLGTLYSLRAFFTRPTHAETLARYPKFEQLIYLPYLGKLLKRLMRMRREEGQHMLVWGNFTQLYHYTDCPSADPFIHYCMEPWDHPDLEGFYDAVIGGLVKRRPLYLVKAYPDLDMGELKVLTGLDYHLIKTVLCRYPVYRLKNYAPPELDPLTLPWSEKMARMERLTQGRHTPGINDTDLKQGRVLKAFNECRKLLTLNRNDRDGLIFLAELCEQRGMQDQAVAIYEKVLAKQPSTPHLRLMLARVRIIQNRIEEAAALMEEEERRFGSSGEVEIIKGKLAQADGNIEKAIDHFQTASLELPERWTLKLDQAVCYERMGQIAPARKRYLLVWEKGNQDDDSGLRTQAAVGLARLAKPVKPETESLKDYLIRDPKNEPLQYALASALERAGEIKQARQQFEAMTQSLTSDTLLAATYFRLARLSENGNREYLLNECLKRDPTHTGANALLQSLEACHASA